MGGFEEVPFDKDKRLAVILTFSPDIDQDEADASGMKRSEWEGKRCLL